MTSILRPNMSSERVSQPEPNGTRGRHGLNLFKTFSLTWWQAGLFKMTMIAYGVALATTWPGGFAQFQIAAWIIFAVGAILLVVIWARQ